MLLDMNVGADHAFNQWLSLANRTRRFEVWNAAGKDVVLGSAILTGNHRLSSPHHLVALALNAHQKFQDIDLPSGGPELSVKFQNLELCARDQWRFADWLLVLGNFPIELIFRVENLVLDSAGVTGPIMTQLK